MRILPGRTPTARKAGVRVYVISDQLPAMGPRPKPDEARPVTTYRFSIPGSAR